MRSSNHGYPWSVILLIVATSFVLFGLYQWSTNRPVSYGPGMVAPHAPEQETIENGAPFSHRGYSVTPLATFSVEGRVLGTKRYADRGSDLAPIDLALGWGPMSDEAVLKDIRISQSSRFYIWRTETFPIPRKAIEENSANMHLIPATHDIAKRLRRARKGHIVGIRGYLVNVDSGDNWHWRSSLTRKDTGNGACELIWVEAFEIR
jgi:hypothetical protein